MALAGFVKNVSSLTERIGNRSNDLGRVENLDSGATANDHKIDEVTYIYNSAGIRISKEYNLYHDYDEVDDEDGPADRVFQTGSTETTDYLIDVSNHTGFAQVLQQQQTGQDSVMFVLGHDVIGQATGAAAPKFYLYDGHGSVRHLADNTGNITESYHFNAYGQTLANSTSNPTSNLLYTGEWFDSEAAQYYLRARWYNPSNGRFNRMDPFAGNNQDPQSLHKYLYAHNNPVNGADPSGLSALVTTMKVAGLAFMVAGLGLFTYGAISDNSKVRTIGFTTFLAGLGLLGGGFWLAREGAKAGSVFIAAMLAYIARVRYTETQGAFSERILEWFEASHLYNLHISTDDIIPPEGLIIMRNFEVITGQSLNRARSLGWEYTTFNDYQLDDVILEYSFTKNTRMLQIKTSTVISVSPLVFGNQEEKVYWFSVNWTNLLYT